jgi:response regulator RpfG family c-di-GMP phosphodiesterase
MRHQNQRLKCLLWLVFAQTACVAAAIGIYYQMAQSLVCQYVGKEMSRELAAPLIFGAGYTLVWSGALLTVVTYLFVTRIFEEFSRRRSVSDAEALCHVRSLVRTRDAVIFGLAKLAESRDDETGRHLDRISAYASCLAVAASNHPKYRDQITPEFVELLRISTPLHDIGKVGIPDKILLKPGRLTPVEQREMQEHSMIGAKCLSEIERRLGNSNFLQMARAIILSHHERWDGSGYPVGLSGEAIPLAARIAAVADVYDALSSDRVYRAALPHDKCVAIIRSETGQHFDPDLVDIFLKIERSFHEIACLYGNGHENDAESEPPPAILIAAELPFNPAAIMGANPRE